MNFILIYLGCEQKSGEQILFTTLFMPNISNYYLLDFLQIPSVSASLISSSLKSG